MSQSQSPPQPDLAKLVAWAISDGSKLVDFFKDTGKDFCDELVSGILAGQYPDYLVRVPYPYGTEFPHVTSNGDVGILKVQATIAPKYINDANLTLRMGYDMKPTLMEVQQQFLLLRFGAIETVDNKGPLLQVRNKEPIEVKWKTRGGRKVDVNIIFTMDLDEECLRGFHKALGSPAL